MRYKFHRLIYVISNRAAQRRQVSTHTRQVCLTQVFGIWSLNMFIWMPMTYRFYHYRTFCWAAQIRTMCRQSFPMLHEMRCRVVRLHQNRIPPSNRYIGGEIKESIAIHWVTKIVKSRESVFISRVVNVQWLTAIRDIVFKKCIPQFSKKNKSKIHHFNGLS